MYLHHNGSAVRVYSCGLCRIWAVLVQGLARVRQWPYCGLWGFQRLPFNMRV